ncbi:hypothetical protein WNY61_00055 [Sulfitobacter sp. AS92]|uniref:hypothetical protein n=1 Tax=Sulfitobacter sp. AS92 TaxID=3135783 RepID=UPI00316CB8E5
MTNYANSLRKLTMTTAVTALMAAPIAAMAQTADVGAGADVNAGVSADVAGTATGADVAAGADSALSTDQTIATDAETDADIAFDGSTVAVASDDTVIGTISNAEPQDDGSVRYSIDLADDFAAGSDRAVVQIDQVVDADGQLAIGMTGEEFAAALTQQTTAGGTAQTQTN